MGSDADLVFVSGHLAMVYTWLGRYSVAADVADDMMRRGEQPRRAATRSSSARTQRALASAYLGRERPCASDARAAIAGAHQCGAPFLDHVAADRPRLPRGVAGQLRQGAECVAAVADRRDDGARDGDLPGVVHARRRRGDGRPRSTRRGGAARRGAGSARCRAGPAVDVGGRCARSQHAAGGRAAISSTPRRRCSGRWCSTTGCRCRSSGRAPSCSSVRCCAASARRTSRPRRCARRSSTFERTGHAAVGQPGRRRTQADGRPADQRTPS